MRRAAEHRLMRFDSGDQQIRIAGTLVVYLVIDHDLIFGFLQFHHLAEFIRLGRLAPGLRRGRLLRMTSVDGSNRLSSLPSERVSPRKMRALVCFITCLTSGTMLSSLSRRPSSASCCKTFLDRFTPSTISFENRFPCPTTRLVELSSWP